VAGFDDVRRFNTLNGATPLPCYAAEETIDAMRHIFPYISSAPNEQGLFRPMINYVPAVSEFTIGDVTVEPLPVEHGPRTNGYLITRGSGAEARRLAYIPDCHVIPDAAVERVRGVDVMVMDCLRERSHPTHLNLEQALAYMERIRPGRGFFVHMCHDVLHAEFETRLPPHIRLAYDGLKVEV